MALNTLKCNHLTPLGLKGLRWRKSAQQTHKWQDDFKRAGTTTFSVTARPTYHSFAVVLCTAIWAVLTDELFYIYD